MKFHTFGDVGNPVLLLLPLGAEFRGDYSASGIAFSCGVLMKSGMRREAHYKEKCKYTKHGMVSWQDELEYAILKTER